MRKRLSGIAVISADFNSVLTSALSVCSSCASDATVIVSLTVPTSSAMSTRESWPIATGTLDRTPSRNPCRETLTSYAPGGTLARLYAPSEFVTVSRVRLVSLLMTVTVAPGTVEPWESLTTPTTLPYST